MSHSSRACLLGLVLASWSATLSGEQDRGGGLTTADLLGTWAGTITHDGETQPFALHLEPGKDDKLGVRFSIPAIYLEKASAGAVVPQFAENELQLGPFKFVYDRAAKTLRGTIPAALAPVYDLPITLRRVERFETPVRPALEAPVVEPVWTFDAGAPLWAGPTFADAAVYAGGQDGRVHAVDARTGKLRWSFTTGGPFRTRPTVAGDEVYVQADDGFLYKLASETGKELWKIRAVEKPIERLPFDNPKSRYDRFGSDVTVAGARLYLGTHDGLVLAIDRVSGSRIWQFAARDAVLAAPAVAGESVCFGSYDHFVYALDAATGRLLWKRDTKGAVVSTPAVHGDRVVIGNRSYDLLGLDASTGDVSWRHYFWFSWVESSATIRDGVAYVGSSDAAHVSAFAAQSGELRWRTDVHGWCWGQPAVTERRVYLGTSSTVGYLSRHASGVLALDRASGRVTWRYPSPVPEKGAYGFPGSPAVGAGLVFVTGLDGRIYAFAQ